MNQFKNGTLLVVIATVVTAVLLLMTGRDTSSSFQKNHIIEDRISSAAEEPQIEVTVPKIESEPVLTEEIAGTSQAMTETTTTLVENNTAPIGPFSKVEGSLVDNETNNIAKQVTDSTVNIEPTTVVATTSQEDVTEQQPQPIWLEQKLGDFKSLDKRDGFFELMPTSPNGLQGEDPQQVVTSKSDKFAPITVSDKYNYQQMPMYNGGYYIAPMPSYFMESMLPGNPKNKK